MEPDERFEIQLSHVCNNRCVFCVSGQMTELRRARPTPLPELLERFDDAAARGITKVTILGGEPTIHATFFPTVKYALELGFETVVIFTNGTRLDKQDFIDRIMAVGKDRLEWRISIQGWDHETHDATTKRVGSFEKIVKGLESLAALGQHISCNMCVVEQNYRSLAKLPEFVRRYDIKQVHLDMVRPRDSGERTEDYLDGIMPDYADLGRVMGGMLDELEKTSPGFDINIGNLPYCQLPEWAHRIHHGGNKTYTVSAEGRGRLSVVAWDKYADKASDKDKLDSCQSCVFERRCDGFFDLYARRRGTEGFLPVSREKLRRIDPDQRAFVHQIDAALVSLASQRFEGWWLHSADDNEFDRWARQTWVNGDGGRATLMFLPADASGEFDAEHRDFVVRVEQWQNVPATRVHLLVAAVFEHMDSHLGGEPRRTPSPDGFARRHGLVAPQQRLAPALVSGLERLSRDSELAAGWRVSEVTSQNEASAQLGFSGPGGARATLHLGTAGGRISGRWDFGRGHEAAKRELAMAVTRRLRPTSASNGSAAAPAE